MLKVTQDPVNQSKPISCGRAVNQPPKGFDGHKPAHGLVDTRALVLVDTRRTLPLALSAFGSSSSGNMKLSSVSAVLQVTALCVLGTL